MVKYIYKGKPIDTMSRDELRVVCRYVMDQVVQRGETMPHIAKDLVAVLDKKEAAALSMNRGRDHLPLPKFLQNPRAITALQNLEASGPIEPDALRELGVGCRRRPGRLNRWRRKLAAKRDDGVRA